MPDFVNPFSGKVPDRKLTLEELVRAIRLDVAAELEAVHLYMAQAEATDNALARKVLTSISNEERGHMGEFMRLLQLLTGDEDSFLAEGASEVNKMAEAAGNTGSGIPATGDREKTIGSLKE